MDRHEPEYSLMLDEGDGDWADYHKQYTEWVKTQPPATKSKLALMLTEGESALGTDADALSEMDRMGASMERAAAAQADATKVAALARERTSAKRDQARATQKDKDAAERRTDRQEDAAERQKEREAAREERREERADQLARLEMLAETFKAVVPNLNPQAAAAAAAASAPPPAASAASEPRHFDSLQGLLSASGAADVPSLLSKFEAEKYDLDTLRTAYQSGGEQSVMEDLKELDIALGDRRRIIKALGPSAQM